MSPPAVRFVILGLVVLILLGCGILWPRIRRRFLHLPAAQPLPKSVKAAHIVFGLLLIVWPIFAGADVFLFDSPSRDTAYEQFRETCFWVVFCYPAFYSVGIILGRIGRRWGKHAELIFALLPFIPVLAQSTLLARHG